MTTTTTGIMRPQSSGSPARNDALAQFREPVPRSPADFRSVLRMFWAFCLLATGVGVAVWLIVLIHAAVFEPRSVGLLDRLAPTTLEDLTMTVPAGTVTLPPAGMMVIGYFLLFLLAWIAAKVVAMMIKEGAGLLRFESASLNIGEPTAPAVPHHSQV
ncbi:MAG TPA: hypothetical protein VGR35_10850 [Tepidisphaeraceae bacterium]|nr:hypothetical protein [Tepidisphaeraceae bacterium]